MRDEPIMILGGTPEMEHFRMLQLMGALSIEVRTGMKVGPGSLLKAVEMRYGIKARTKKAALEKMRALYEQVFDTPAPFDPGGRS